MRLRQLALIVASFVFLPTASHAQLTLSAGLEYFEWKEYTTPAVTEEGPLYAVSISYAQKRDSGFLLGYRGKLWTGTVDYTGSTLFTNQPITGSTGYIGLANEVQGRWRNQLQDSNYQLDFLASAGIEAWRRELLSIQREDYTIVFLRAGLEIDSASQNTWLLGLGVKYPVRVREDAHLTSIGFDSNPELNPAGKVSAYASIGYRLDARWSIAGYADGFRFGQSNEVAVTEIRQGYGPITVYQPASDMLVIGIRVERRLR